MSDNSDHASIGSRPSYIATSQSPGVVTVGSSIPVSTSSAAATMTAPKPSELGTTGIEQEQFRLLDLPLELVVRIIGYAVVTSTEERPLDVNPSSAVQPAITRACRLLRAEGLKLFYACNCFSITATSSRTAMFWRWRAAIGQAKAAKIKRLFVQLVASNGYPLDLGRVQWHWWLTEVEFHNRYVAKENLPAVIYVRMMDDRVVMFPTDNTSIESGRYEISFTDRSNEGECWRNLDDFPPSPHPYNTMYDRAKAESKDWWTRPS
ncbi:hypothetical protein AC578_3697 [Pseudocercospora eumusae]|uniref:F-box domain-containing protein n=1 Tax=Pseudocercospora eumusae TaxID=321146 RepID=A0A139HSU2_9PEZI|nr:hypothetical protein AC578_3697 [Pseudocercospora eumusae]